MLNIYDDITYKWNVSMILIICEVIELRLYVVFNGRYVMYDNIMQFSSRNGTHYMYYSFSIADIIFLL